MNNIKVIENIKKLIKRGYGYNQMLDKSGLTVEGFNSVCLENLQFKNLIEKRYGVKIEPQVKRKRRLTDED